MKSNLYQHIDTAKHFQGEPKRAMPVVDRSAGTKLSFDWAKRQAARPAPEPIRSTPHAYPIGN